MTITSPAPWKSESQRYDYPLTKDSVVVDAGGYRGEFAIGIASRYGCKVISYEPLFIKEFRANTEKYPTITLRPHALGAFARGAKIAPLDNGSTLLKEHEDSVDISVVGLDDAFAHGDIDLLKLNVEGMEYEILDEMIGTGLIRNVRFLQVQFHGGVSEQRLKMLIESIQKTHDLVWGDAPFLWLSFEKKKTIESNSQAGQDIFAWHVSCCKRDGTFVDIGSAHGQKWSNTYALEQMGWTGILCDASGEARASALTLRKSPFVLGNATELNWNSILTSDWYDYLSLDVDAATLDTLKALPLARVQFGCITIEHDAYRFDTGPRNAMREILSRNNYSLLVADVSNDGFIFEDWWVHPTVKRSSRVDKLIGMAGQSWQHVIKCLLA